MYCKTCGTEIRGQAGHCPHCGAPIPQTGPGGGAGTAAPALKDRQVAGMSIFRLALCVLGALHVLAFFLLSYAELSGAGRLLGFVLPEKMTAMSYISFTADMVDLGAADGSTLALNALVCILPAIIGVLLLVFNLTRRTRKTYVRSIVFGAAALVIYLLLGAAMAQCESVGYELTSGGTLGALLGVLTLVAAVAGLAMDPSAKK